MKKLLTLGALGLMSASTALAQAPTLDGHITAAEIGTGPGQYQSIGQFTNPRGFGDWGLKQAFVAEDANYLYVAINGTVEGNGNSFQIYFDVPNFQGAPACSPLTPAPSASGDPTSFASMGGTLDMETDAGVAYRVNAGTPQFELCDYRVATPASVILGTMTSDGTPSTFLMGAAKAAYKDSPTSNILSNTDEGLEFAVLKAAYQMTAGTAVKLFVLMNNGDGGFASTDFIPQDPTMPTTAVNLGTGFDMCLDFPGNQYATYVIGQGVVGLKKLNADAINFSVAPNPIAGGTANVSFSVPGGKAEQGSVIVTDMMGRTVATLANGTIAAGKQQFNLNTANLASGQYIVKLVLGDKVATRKVSVL
jgi:Secretion system C-terminal sorting domain